MPDEDRDRHKAFERTVQGKAARKIRARRNRERGIWFSLGMMGLVGWSVTLPAVLGAFVGRWLDHRWPTRVSWTLTLLLIGVGIGCYTAWHWIKEEGGKRG